MNDPTRSERFYEGGALDAHDIAEQRAAFDPPPCRHDEAHNWTPHLRCRDCGYLVPDPAREAIRLFVEAHAHYFDKVRVDPDASSAARDAAKAVLRERYAALEALCR